MTWLIIAIVTLALWVLSLEFRLRLEQLDHARTKLSLEETDHWIGFNGEYVEGDCDDTSLDQTIANDLAPLERRIAALEPPQVEPEEPWEAWLRENRARKKVAK